MDALLLLKASLLLAGALGAAALLRRSTATLRHQLWTLTFLGLLALPLLSAMTPRLPVPVPRMSTVAPVIGVPTGPGPSAAVAAFEASNVPDVSTVLLWVWCGGSTIAAGMVLLSLWRVRRLRLTATELTDPAWRDTARTIAARLPLSASPKLLMSPLVRTPMAGGLHRPVVFLPEDAATWSDECREVVLAHELAHLARRDPLRHVAARLTVALYWFHPLAWLAARRARAAQEQACDELVLSLGTRPSVYARVLMDLASPPASPHHLAALPMAERPFLETRIMAILSPGSRSTRWLPFVLAAAIAVVTLSVAAAQPRPNSSAGAGTTSPQTTTDSELRAALEAARQTEIELRARVATMREGEAALKANIAELMANTNALRGQVEAFRSEAEARRSRASEASALVAQRELAELKARADREKSQQDRTRAEILKLTEQLTQVQTAVVSQKLSETHQVNELQKILEIVKDLALQKLTESQQTIDKR